jgi:hypothetical protein
MKQTSVAVQESEAVDVKYTVLRRPDSIWYRNEISKMMNGLLAADAHTCQKYPAFVVLLGGHSKEEIRTALGSDAADFEHRIVAGYRNPELPFHIPWTN